MALRDRIEERAGRSVTLRTFSAEPMPWVGEHLAGPNVEVNWEPLPDDGPGGFIAVEADGEFLGSVDATAAAALAAGGGTDTDGRAALSSLLALLREVTFTTMERAQLLATSREFEDRAWRVGEGRLHVGFQRPGAMESRRAAYAELADCDGLDVHVYAGADWNGDPIPGTTAHAAPGTELGTVWFIAFDGGRESGQACLLLAEEHEPGAFRGFWSYDPELVADVLDYLTETYG